VTIPVFIGFDPREAVAFHVCVNSIIRHSQQPIAIHPLALNLLNNYQESHSDGSNHFIYSRFLVPSLMNYQGWAVFIDGDMILRSDISELWNLRNDDYDVIVVKHDYKTRQSTKYMGSANHDYPRKNWSSVILWNCQSPNNRCLTSEYIEKSSGSHLHRFQWLDDQRIGSLPMEWNWLPDEYGANPTAKLLHFTLGTPCFQNYTDSPQSHEWFREHILTNYCQQDLP
jgi:lipopolysaccharide biosynthesis glycosyltransferase